MRGNTGKIIFLFSILIAGLGFWGAIEFFGELLGLFVTGLIELNRAVYESFGESLLSDVFKHFITFKIVGLVLSTGIAGGSSFLGKWIGKTAYAITILGVIVMLNFITILIG